MKLRKLSNFFLGLPSFVWLVVFYAIPIILVLIIAFKPVDSYGGLAEGWTLDTRTFSLSICPGVQSPLLLISV